MSRVERVNHHSQSESAASLILIIDREENIATDTRQAGSSTAPLNWVLSRNKKAHIRTPQADS
jgi:hypothetical protein